MQAAPAQFPDSMTGSRAAPDSSEAAAMVARCPREATISGVDRAANPLTSMAVAETAPISAVGSPRKSSM